MRYSYYPQSLAQICGSIQGDQELDLGVLTRRRCSTESSGHTVLTGASHRSDRCRLSVEFCSGERLGEFPVVLGCGCFEFGYFWSSGGQVCALGLPGLDRSDWRATPA
jgi:hypothetical protein